MTKPDEKNIRLLIQYKGTNYSGWQSQLAQETIQDLISSAIHKTTGEKVNLIAAGRTDAGVHALGQVANFKITHKLETDKYKDALNFYLNDDIRIIKSDEVELNFNSRFDAISKRYRYLVSTEKSALYHEYRWELGRKIDVTLLKKSAELIVGRHDFSPFCVTASLKENNDCLIHSARWFQYGDLLSFEIRGNRFLHSMIRSLVGCMINLAQPKPDKNRQNLTLDGFGDIIQTQNKERVTFKAPASGLYLKSVQYKKEQG